MQQLLGENEGKVMHTKTFIQRDQPDPSNGENATKSIVQIRCYFAYNKDKIMKSKEQWAQFI